MNANKHRLMSLTVLKCRFRYSGIVRPADQQPTTLEKMVYYSQLPRGGDRPHHTGPPEKNGVSREAEEARWKRGSEPLLWFPWEKQGKAG